MNRAYITHISGNGALSQMIKSITSLNYPYDDILFTHNAFMYEDNQNKFWIVEIGSEVGMIITSFEEYPWYSVDNFAYTPLPNNLITEDNYDRFIEFIITKFQDGAYSVHKALKSLRINDLPDLDMLQIFEEKVKEEITRAEKNKENINYKNVLSGLFFEIANEFKEYGKEHEEKGMEEMGNSILEYMSEEDANNIGEDYQNEKNNKGSKKFFYCSEFLINIVKDWCEEINIKIPALLANCTIGNKKPEEIYPQELFNLILDQGEHNIFFHEIERESEIEDESKNEDKDKDETRI
jgi:hypothetical protein